MSSGLHWWILIGWVTLMNRLLWLTKQDKYSMSLIPLMINGQLSCKEEECMELMMSTL